MTRPSIFAVLLGIFVVLVVASLLGQALRRRYSPDGRNDAVENFNTRIAAWWAMVILLGAAFLIGRGGVIVLFALLSFSALREFLTLTTKARADHLSLAAAFFIILPAQYALIWTNWYGLFAILIPVWAFLFLPVLSALRGTTRDFLARVSETQWALMICVYSVSHVAAILALDLRGFQGQNLLLIAWLILVVEGSDVLQYLWGKLLGRHKIAPDLSPSKTWEGFLGGTISATIIGAALWRLTPYDPQQAAVMALIVTLMGFFGGLVMSAIKRDRGIKDWGHLIAGHGGFLDRLDSVVFAAPVLFHLTRYFWSVG